VVDETPRPDEGSAALREGASHGKCARTAERNIPRFENLEAAPPGLGEQHLGGILLEVAHDFSVVTRALLLCANQQIADLVVEHRRGPGLPSLSGLTALTPTANRGTN
jgi:hypothetical protein